MEAQKKENNIASLLKSGAQVVNFGMTSFSDDLKEQNIPTVQIEWAPKTAGKELLAKLRALRSY